MKKKLVRVLVLIFAIGLILKFGGLELFKPTTVRAVGDLIVDFHVSAKKPIFEVFNMVPGDMEDRNIDVINNGDDSQMVLVRGERRNGTGIPKIETALEIIIKDEATILYGPRKLSEFFIDSKEGNGLQLSIIKPREHKTYNFEVTLPHSSGNEFQKKSVVFDLTIGAIVQEQIVINEVYYKVDENHTFDSESGKKKEKDKVKNDEWVELYNPGDHEISLKNWTLTDNSNKQTRIHGKKEIKTGGFALLSKKDSLWEIWNEDKKALKIDFGKDIGNGLDDSGDHSILRNSFGIEIDRMSWGSDTSGFTPNAVNPVVPLGSATERLVPGFDTDTFSDWHEQNPPTPGS